MAGDEESSEDLEENSTERSDESQAAGSSQKAKWSDPLLVTAALTVSATLLALAAIAAAAYAFHWEGFWRGMGQPYATTLAALAAVSAGAIALHNSRSQLSELRAQRELDHIRWEAQRDQDQARWEDQKTREAVKELRGRFSEITTQLADEKPTVRRSGAYAMAALANDWHAIGEQAEMKVCFGVLAAYLTAPNPDYQETPKPDAGDDGHVRALIVALLSRNADSGLEDLWGNSRLLKGADLRGVKFTAPVDRVDFSEADLKNASFIHAKLRNVQFWEAKLSGADFSFSDLRGANFSFAEMVDTDLWGADLRNARLYHATLTRADFTHVSLAGASLEDSRLQGVDLSSVALDDVLLKDIDYDEKTLWPEGFTPPRSLFA